MEERCYSGLFGKQFRWPWYSRVVQDCSEQENGMSALISFSHILGAILRCKHLKINFANCSVEGRQLDGAQKLAASMSKLTQLHTLELNLENNDLGCEVAELLGESLRACKLLRTLLLNLSGNHVGPSGAKGLAQSLGCAPRLDDLALILSGSQIGTAGLNSIGEGLASAPRLRQVDMDLRHNTFSDAALDGFGNSFRGAKNYRKLSYVGLPLDGTFTTPSVRGRLGRTIAQYAHQHPMVIVDGLIISDFAIF